MKYKLNSYEISKIYEVLDFANDETITEAVFDSSTHELSITYKNSTNEENSYVTALEYEQWEQISMLEIDSDYIEKVNVRQLVNKIATSIFCEVTTSTTSCCWCVYGEELEKEYELKEGTIKQLKDDIVDALYNLYAEQILEMEVYEENGDIVFDLDLGTSYCTGYLEDDYIEQVDWDC